MTRKEKALEKIYRLEGLLDMGPSDWVGEGIEREICRLQQVYGITLEDIQGPRDYAKMFPFLPEEVIRLMREGEVRGDNDK